MKRLLIISFVIFIASCSGIAENNNTKEVEAIITTLASDEYGGRYPGQPGYEKAAIYAETFLKDNGIKPYFTSYRDTFLIDNRVTTYNIVGLIGEHKPNKEYIIIGAHLDHLQIDGGHGIQDSIFNGANDNASGCTAALQIAKNLAKQQYDKNVLIVLFSAEEQGLLGSKHLAKKLKNDDFNLAYMINFEMIGKTYTKGKDLVYLTGHDKSDMAKQMNTAAGKEFINYEEMAKQYDLFNHSDNAPFYEAFKVPCHSISSFDFKNYDYYHKTEDEVKELDIENMAQIISTTSKIIAKLLTDNTSITNSK